MIMDSKHSVVFVAVAVLSIGMSAAGCGSNTIPIGRTGDKLGQANGGCTTTDGRTFAPGDHFSAIDGCNACTCSEGNLIACTEIACADGGPQQIDGGSGSLEAGPGCTYDGHRRNVG